VKRSELAKLWRGFGYNILTYDWTCNHCSAVVKDPEVHTTWHRDVHQILTAIVDVI
jgi:hypothetical protein